MALRGKVNFSLKISDKLKNSPITEELIEKYREKQSERGDPPLPEDVDAEPESSAALTDKYRKKMGNPDENENLS